MHEVYDVEIPGILWAIALAVVVTFLIFNHSRTAAAHRLEILKLQKLAADEIARAEQEEAEDLLSMRLRPTVPVVHNYTPPPQAVNLAPIISDKAEPLQTVHSSPAIKQTPPTDNRALAGLGLCAVCSTPTKKQCSRCKAVKYCSRECQVAHWSNGHKQECHESKKEPTIHSAQSNLIPDPAKSKSLAIRDENLSERAKPEEETREERPRATSIRKLLRAAETYSADGSLPNPTKILFPYDYFVELFTQKDVKLLPCGLINCGNSCFANVVLQCLTFTRPLAVYLLKGCHQGECGRHDWCFMCELQHHVFQVRDNQLPFSPLRIVSQIRNIGNHMGYGRQEDAHEFMRVAIDSMQSICLDSVGGEKAVDQRTQETTFIQHVFGGHLQSQVRCIQCHQESYKYENMMDLAVEIEGNVETLEDALEQFTTPEWLDGENKYKCDSCNAYVKAWKRLVVHEAPNILTIALKRFQSGKFGKLNKRVSFPELLDISSFMSGEGDKPPLYYLYGVIVHIDMLNSSFFGHYICYIKDFQNCWYKIDDSKVKEVELEKVLQQRAYMLLYARSVVRRAPSVADTVQHSEGWNSGLYILKKKLSSNGSHLLPETSRDLEEFTNAHSTNTHSNNGDVSFREGCDFLTQ